MLKTLSYKSESFSPSKIVCVGRNYLAHIKELGNSVPAEPVIFLKPNSALSNELHSGDSETIHYEAEIVFLIKNGQLNAMALGLDLTKRVLQNDLRAKGLPWERSKAFDASCALSDFIDLPEQLDEIEFKLLINSQTVQYGTYTQMINKPDTLLKWVADFMTFSDGDLLMTGTPEGVGEVKRGDVFEGHIYLNKQLLLTHTWHAI